jgi:hypothetical protein
MQEGDNLAWNRIPSSFLQIEKSAPPERWVNRRTFNGYELNQTRACNGLQGSSLRICRKSLRLVYFNWRE